MEILAGDVDLGGLIVQRVGRIQLGEVLCADVEGGRAGAVDRSDEDGDVLMVGQVGGGAHGEDAGELDAQIVPVADLIAHLDLDGVAGAGAAAAQHGSSAQSGGGSAGALEEGAAGNLIGHGCVPP